MQNDPTTAERKIKTGPLPELPAQLPADRLPGRNTSMIRVGIGIAVALVAAIGIFLLTRPSDPMADPRPVEVARNFITALEKRDLNQMLLYVEPTVLKREMRPQIEMYLGYIEEIRFDDANYTLLDNDGELAHVRLTATVRYRMNYGSEVKSSEGPVDNTYKLTKVEGSWYLSGITLPEQSK